MVYLFLAILLGGNAFADSKQFYFERIEQAKLEATNSVVSHKAPDPQIYSQKRDHFGVLAGKFDQRYWVDSSFAKGPSAPVFFYLCGESTCAFPANYVVTLAEKFHGHLVVLEHRYYGKSQPFPTLSTANMKWLTTEEAIEDAAEFQVFAQKKYELSDKWIVVGGSYPGSLSAYYRLKHPELVVGSLASSAPVQARGNFEEYDHHVFQTVTPQCAQKMKEVVQEVEGALSDPKQLAAIKEKFQATSLTEDDDFLYLVADMGALAVQYGYRERFCDLLNGKAALDGYAEFTRDIFSEWHMDALSDSAEGAFSENPDDYLAVFGLRQWFYQSCTEYGYWQNAYHDEKESVRSARINPAYHNHLCERLFGITQPVNTNKINTEFLAPLMLNASRIFLSNGSEDPWSKLSLAEGNGNATNPNLNYLTMSGGSHCSDLRRPSETDLDSVKAGREEFERLASSWLDK